MIKSIELENYRCFYKHKIKFNDLSIVVGKNNAGKSTLIEALRLVSIVTNKYKNLAYKLPPAGFGVPNIIGVNPSLKGIEISLKNIFYNLGTPPVKITVSFNNDLKIELFIGEDYYTHAVLYDEHGKIIKNKIHAKQCIFPEINILPQIGPLKENEDLLNEDYVKSNIYSNRASSHFRNQLQFFYDDFYEIFCKLVQDTWKNIKISGFIKGDKISGQQPGLFIEDGTFVAEVGWIGHGLQMWLQTMWFLARCKEGGTVILDEPDVYLHADLQRKLIRFLKSRFTQVIIATHSIEIISEVDPENILVIDKSKNISEYSTNLPAVQEIINNIGSIQNLELIRCWSSKKFIILEGKVADISILKIIQDKLFSDSEEPFDIIPTTHVEGWSGWQRVIGSKLALKNIKDMSIYCIFDSDYHLEDEKNQRLSEAKVEGINLHIWSRKEIENYLIVPSAILRLILTKYTMGCPCLELVNEKIDQLLEEMKEEISDNYSNEIKNKNKLKDVKTCNKEARTIVNKHWLNNNSKLSIVPGKKMIGALSDWSKGEFGVSFNVTHIARTLNREEIDTELVNVITAIEKKSIFK